MDHNPSVYAEHVFTPIRTFRMHTRVGYLWLLMLPLICRATDAQSNIVILFAFCLNNHTDSFTAY